MGICYCVFYCCMRHMSALYSCLRYPVLVMYILSIACFDLILACCLDISNVIASVEFCFYYDKIFPLKSVTKTTFIITSSLTVIILSVTL